MNEPVKFAMFGPNANGVYVKQRVYHEAMKLTKEVHEERLRALRDITTKMAESNAKLRAHLKIAVEK